MPLAAKGSANGQTNHDSHHAHQIVHGPTIGIIPGIPPGIIPGIPPGIIPGIPPGIIPGIIGPENISQSGDADSPIPAPDDLSLFSMSAIRLSVSSNLLKSWSNF
jgi:hypothetical protein